jgi:hypothetical protein
MCPGMTARFIAAAAFDAQEVHAQDVRGTFEHEPHEADEIAGRADMLDGV